MALVRAIIKDALLELGVIDPAGTLDPSRGALGLSRIQGMIDSWAANRLTLSSQLRTTFVMPSGTSSIQIGPSATVVMQRPMWINSLNYIIPASSPEVEVPIGQMDDDGYAALSIKQLSSALPLQSYYQTNLTDTAGTLFLWPKVSQNVTIAIYTPQVITVPATLDTDLIGPPGYQEAFLYGLARRLVTPLGVSADAVPALDEAAARAWTTMTRPNITPGVLGIDAALIPGSGSGYNVYSDTVQGSR